MTTKRVESLRAPCLDTSSTLATSTFEGTKSPPKWIKDIDNQLDCQCLFVFITFIPIANAIFKLLIAIVDSNLLII